uniref:Putative ovule protein n=1 Tax=Solanum chacoense TaxID=4108 RepID=A0A0V0GNS2_SOLCH
MPSQVHSTLMKILNSKSTSGIGIRSSQSGYSFFFLLLRDIYTHTFFLMEIHKYCCGQVSSVQKIIVLQHSGCKFLQVQSNWVQKKIMP